MRLTRRRFVAGAVVAALGGLGVENLLDRLTGRPRPLPTGRRPVEQHVLQRAQVVVDDGVEVLVPPLHHRVVTARVRVAESPAALREAQHTLESALAQLDARYAASPAGLVVTVAWGLPYFRRFVPDQARRELPVDRRASAARGRTIRVRRMQSGSQATRGRRFSSTTTLPCSCAATTRDALADALPAPVRRAARALRASRASARASSAAGSDAARACRSAW